MHRGPSFTSVRPVARAALGLLSGLALSWPASGRAEEPKRAGEPKVFWEPAEITQVVDAFDDDDPFDLNLSLGFQSSWKSADILRETSITQPGLTTGGYTPTTLNVAKYKESTTRLNVRADVGVYKDVALVLRMPVILSNDRELRSLHGSAGQQSVILEGAPGEQLFSLPFKSPTRNGIEYLAIGIDAAIMTQARDRTKPTWVVGLEGRFDVAEPMHACGRSSGNQPGPQQRCAHFADVNRNGVDQESSPDDGTQIEGTFSGGRDPGVSRGVTALELHAYISHRIKYIEPYGGFRTLFEFQHNGSDYGATDLKGSLVNHPPLRGTMLVGISVVPWEIRERFQRIAIDGRFTGTYVSEGRDYSELFDALGSSDAPSLRKPNYSSYMANPDAGTRADTPSVVDPSSQPVYFTGLTDVQQHGVYTFSTSATWQAGEYVKFGLGGGLTLTQGHFLTFDQPCNPDFDSEPERSGYCRNGDASTGITASGIPNPNYRKTVNDPGHRFKVDQSTQLDLWVNATVMF